MWQTARLPASVTHQYRRVAAVTLPTVGDMSLTPLQGDPTAFPSTRDGLDTGSIAELVADCLALHLEVHEARPWPLHGQVIAVPDDASSLVEGLGTYGS